MTEQQDEQDYPKIEFNVGDMVVMIGQLTNAVLNLSSAVFALSTDHNEGARLNAEAAIKNIDPILELFRIKIEGSVSDAR